MPRIRPALLALALTAGTIAACQTPPSPPPPTPSQALEPAAGTEGQIERQRRGWTVALHQDNGKPALCLASRLGAGGVNLAFATTAAEGRILLRNVATNAEPGTVVTVNASIEGAEPLSLTTILRTDGTLAAVVPFDTFEATTAPLAHGKRVTFQSDRLTQTLKPINLTGSEWAINAVMECRILHLTTRP